MKKIKINGYLKRKSIEEENTNYKLSGILNNNIIDYEEKDKTKISLSFNKDSVELTRTNEEMEMSLYFKEDEETNGIYKVKELDLNIPITIFTDKLRIEKNSILIKYYLTLDIEDLGLFEYFIEYKE
jgi:uncharacterized beta-barrel protein YwiB (DUF1934 family)